MTQPALLPLRPEDLKPLVRSGLPWTPFDFVKGISVDGDRAVHADAILRPLAPADDLRIVYPLDGHTEVVVCAERLPWDSEFFGYQVARLHGIVPLRKEGFSFEADYEPPLRALVARAMSRGIRYLFAVIDARDLPTIRALTALGFSLLETRLYFLLSLRDYHYPRRFSCRHATAADVEGLERLGQTIDNPYDRFQADPFIPKADVHRLMATWLRASVLHGFADATFVPDVPVPESVCTVKYHDDKAPLWGMSIAQLALTMSAPSARARFLGTISEINYALKERGTDYVFFTTQITNRGASRVGQHLGFRQVGRADYVFRLLL